MSAVKYQGSEHLFAKYLNLPTEALKMTSKYFPNPSPDFDPPLGAPQVPEDNIKDYVNNLISDVKKYCPPIEKNGADGVYVGTAGVSYMFYHLSKLPGLSPQKEVYLSHAMEYIKPAIIVSQLSTKNKADIPSFILGHCGVYAVASAVFHAVGDENQSRNFRDQYYRAAEICKNPTFLSCGSDELFVGRAGYIMGALWLAKATDTPLKINDLYDLCKVLRRSGKDYSVRHRCPSPLMYSYYQVEYLGAAHGLCSILQAILSVPGFLDANPGAALDVKESIDWLLTTQTPNGNFPAATDEIGHESRLVHWCHGAGGMFYLMAKAYLVFREQKYLNSCKQMANLIWEKGLLKKGPGLCHGISGNGYVLLIMYRLTGEPQYLYRAIKFFEFMLTDTFKTQARRPDSPYSLYEGIAGTICFLGDLLNPSQAQFPFSDIF